MFRPPKKTGGRYVFWEIRDCLHSYFKDQLISSIKYEKIKPDFYILTFLDIDNKPLIINIPKNRIEGKKIEYRSVRYERDPVNRQNAIQIHGYKCMACGFDYETTYGELGKEFIEVHHSKPLSTLDGEVNINPKEDLVCLCSNCHSMIHRNKEALSLDELKEIINQNKEI